MCEKNVEGWTWSARQAEWGQIGETYKGDLGPLSYQEAETGGGRGDGVLWKPVGAHKNKKKWEDPWKGKAIVLEKDLAQEAFPMAFIIFCPILLTKMKECVWKNIKFYLIFI